MLFYTNKNWVLITPVEVWVHEVLKLHLWKSFHTLWRISFIYLLHFCLFINCQCPLNFLSEHCTKTHTHKMSIFTAISYLMLFVYLLLSHLFPPPSFCAPEVIYSKMSWLINSIQRNEAWGESRLAEKAK